jgi:hypothetical protein
MVRIQFSLFCFQPGIFSYSVSISFILSLNRRIPPLAYKARRAIVAIKVALVGNNIRKDGKLAPRAVQRYTRACDSKATRFARHMIKEGFVPRCAGRSCVASDAFGAKEMRDFDPASLAFSLDLMKRSGIDAQTYSW